MKKILSVLVIVCLLLVSGCQKKSYQKYDKVFTGYFDTITEYITYATSKEEFQKQCELIEEDLKYYDALFDKYNDHEGVLNVKTINDNAGIKPIQVDQPLIDLLKLSIERSATISNKVNIAFGSVIGVWHRYRKSAESLDGVGQVPTQDELKKANLHTDIKNIEIDEKSKTVFIKDKDTDLDVGATAKGYAIELIKQDLIEMGVDNFLISGGGNVASYGERKIVNEGDFYLSDCQEKFCVGVESPQSGNFSRDEDDPAYNNEAILVVEGQSIVTSGDYQRFYEDVKGVKYHHLIDPETLFPAVNFRSVSIVTEDSGLADFLSSAVFLMSYEEGLKLINSLEGVEAIWMLEDGKIRYSSGLKDGAKFYVVDKERLK